MDKKDIASASIGAITYADLAHTHDFSLACHEDAWGVSRIPFSPQIARMSTELAANAYDLTLQPWMDAGWEDCTFIIEEKIVTLDHENNSRLAALESGWKLRRARSLIQGVRPVADLTRAFRQLLVTDMGKAIVMTRIGEDSRQIIAISFIGTTEKYFDWFTNFKLHRQTGMHHGFLELARQFHTRTPQVLLPKLAAARGEETYTLADAILDAKEPDSPIVFWLSGHSQGGAVVQTFTHLLLSQGIPAERICGYTLAAPTVSVCDPALDPKRFPIYNIVSTDDIVPYIGAQVRLGMDLIYRPTAAFRARYYRVEQELSEAFNRTLFSASQVQTTQDALCWGIALMRLMGDMDSAEDMETFLLQVFPFLGMLKRINLSILDVVDFFLGKLESQYAALNTAPLDEAMVHAYSSSLRTLLQEFGPKQTAHALIKVLMETHRVRSGDQEDPSAAPYVAIVQKHLHNCQEGVWMLDDPPRCVDCNGRVLLPGRLAQKQIEGTAPPLLPEGASQKSPLPPPGQASE